MRQFRLAISNRVKALKQRGDGCPDRPPNRRHSTQPFDTTKRGPTQALRRRARHNLDGFKAINEHIWHEAGDKVLPGPSVSRRNKLESGPAKPYRTAVMIHRALIADRTPRATSKAFGE